MTMIREASRRRPVSGLKRDKRWYPDRHSLTDEVRLEVLRARARADTARERAVHMPRLSAGAAAFDARGRGQAIDGWEEAGDE